MWWFLRRAIALQSSGNFTKIETECEAIALFRKLIISTFGQPLIKQLDDTLDEVNAVTIDRSPKPKKKRAGHSKYRFVTTAAIALLAVIFLQPIAIETYFSQATPTVTVAQTTFPQGWQNVAIGGGGYVTGLTLHPQDANLRYAKTDNGGLYRWDPEEKSWIPLLENFTVSGINYYGTEAVAIDPNDPDIVYVALGKYLPDPSGLFKSSDRGQTWVQSDLKVPMSGDGNLRWAGNRLAVNPFDSNVLLFGSRQDGLWRSQDGGMSWTQVRELNANLDGKIGILAIAFDPETRDRVYASAYDDAIYESTDAGLTWDELEGSPAQAMQLAVASDRSLYVTHSSGVSKYRDRQWQDITPSGDRDRSFNGLSVDRRDPNRAIVSLGETGSATIYLTRDGGETWEGKRSQIENAVPWLPDKYFPDHTAAIAFDPGNGDRVWLTDWFGIWRTEDINASPLRWQQVQQGHEQIVAFTLLSPPEGALLLSGVADVEGFYHNQLDRYPDRRLGYGKVANLYEDSFQDTYSIAYSPSNPQQLVRVGGNRWNSDFSGATSTDGGLTWNEFANFPEETLPLRVAISATNSDEFVVVVKEGQALQTSDRGQSWQSVEGLPNGFTGPWNWSQPLASDRVEGDRFYYYENGTFYRSDDRGLSFAAVNSNLPETEDWYEVKTVPGVAGEVWVSLGDRGLYRSTDAGQTFSKISTVSNATLFDFGKPPQGSEIPALYVYGTRADGNQGIFMSRDRGETWTPIAEGQTAIWSLANSLTASKQQFGLVFVGTNGRGIYYRLVEEDS